MKHVVVGLGANLGAGQETLGAAALALRQAYPNNFTASPLYLSAPQHCPGKSAFLECSGPLLRARDPNPRGAARCLAGAGAGARSGASVPMRHAPWIWIWCSLVMSAWRPPADRAPSSGLGSGFRPRTLAALDPECCWPTLGQTVGVLWAAFTGPRTLELVAQQWC